MDKTPPFDFGVVTHSIISKSRKLMANWTVIQDEYKDICKPYALTEEEKEGLTSDEQSVWKSLKEVELFDLEAELAHIMSSEIAIEIDAGLLKEMLYAGTTTK